MALRLGDCALRELRIHLCQTSKESGGVRDFIKKYYVDLKKTNPDFPILIRECQGVQPRIWGRYEKGVERTIPLTNMAADDVMTTLKKLIVK